MNRRLALTIGGLALAIAVVSVGCGGTGASTAASTSASAAPQTPTASPPAAANQATPSAGALTGEAASAPAGDIPDNQVFLVFHDKPAGVSMKYPEGWAQKGNGGSVTFRDKNNIVRVVVAHGVTPTVASVKAGMARLATATPSLHAGTPVTTTVSGAPAIKVTYTTKSSANPVTGQRVTLTVDRYYLAHAGRVAIIDLGTPVGVDNVDAYRLMVESFAWRG